MRLFDLCVAKKLSGGGGKQSNVDGFLTKSLESVSSNLAEISDGALSDFTNLKSVNFSELLIIPLTAFYNCRSLENCNFPKVTKIGSDISTGYGSPFLDAAKSGTVLTLPSCTDIGYGAFEYSGFGRINLPVAERIRGNAFRGCNSLTAVVVGTRATTTDTNIATSFPQNAILYVNQADLSWYSTAQYWSNLYSSGRIKSIEELPS